MDPGESRIAAGKSPETWHLWGCSGVADGPRGKKKFEFYLPKKNISRPLMITVGGAVLHKIIMLVWPVMISKQGMDPVRRWNSGSCVFCSPVRLQLTVRLCCNDWRAFHTVNEVPLSLVSACKGADASTEKFWCCDYAQTKPKFCFFLFKTAKPAQEDIHNIQSQEEEQRIHLSQPAV